MSTLPDIIHIPKGHELVKRYDPISQRPYGRGWDWDELAIRENPTGEYVRLDELKKHLVEWIEGEFAKLGHLQPTDSYLRAAELWSKGTIHHIQKIL